MEVVPTHPSAAAPHQAGTESSGYAVKLPVFEGPLDLLLHLIRLNEVEITEIPIARIAEQYLEYLDLLRDLDLEAAGEYLVMAATLAWIKSRSLLPSEPSGESEEEEDPRAALVARLLEYQRYKEVAAELGGRELLGRDVFEAQTPGPERTPGSAREIEVGLPELLEALRAALLEATVDVIHQVVTETITVRERMIFVMECLAATESAEFRDLIEPAEGAAITRALLVATFLAILELTRLSAIRLYQGLGSTGAPEGPLRVRRAGEAEDGAWTDQLPELM